MTSTMPRKGSLSIVSNIVEKPIDSPVDPAPLSFPQKCDRELYGVIHPP